MRICICDDDMLISERLSAYIKEYFNRYHITNYELKLFSNGDSLLKDQGVKDLVFLDIEMPGANGIFVGQELKKNNKNTIIFIVTSYSEYLDEAMRFHVFRYLSKPIDKQRLFRNLKDAIQLYHSATVTIPIETKEGIYTASASQIISIEASGRKVFVHTTTKSYESIKNMAHWAKNLPANTFFQSHRSFIINLAFVNAFDHSLIHLYHNQFSAYLTRRKYTDFRNVYLLYLESTR